MEDKVAQEIEEYVKLIDSSVDDKSKRLLQTVSLDSSQDLIPYTLGALLDPENHPALIGGPVLDQRGIFGPPHFQVQVGKVSFGQFIATV